ncbi:MAG: M48 family metallopeptidase [Candidatus Riflebacteria bacterium]|nr:M48 family metallopeptidase [Candidatus Riflebacteria bacterium]
MKEFAATIFGPEDLGHERHGSVRLTGDGLDVTAADREQLFVGYESIEIGRGGTEDKVIVVVGRDSQGHQMALHIRDESFLGDLARCSPPAVARQAEYNRSRGEVAGFRLKLYVVGLAGFLLLAYLLLPELAGMVAPMVPVSTESFLGEAVMEVIAEKENRIEIGSMSDSVQNVWQAVAKGLPANPYVFSVHLVRSEEVNAFAAPGGKIVVFTGLVDRVQSAEELAGILAHEAAHCLKRHSLKQIIKSIGVSTCVAILMGNPGGLGKAVRDLGADLFIQSYSRSDEREADRMAIEIMVHAGIDPSRFPEFFRRLDKEQGDVHLLKILSSHPPNRERDEDSLAILKTVDTSAFHPLQIPWKKH